MTSFNCKLIQILSQKEAILDDMYRKQMEAKLIETLKLLTIISKCITLQLEETMANPRLVATNKNSHPCKNCSVCNEEIIRKKVNRKELKKLLFSVFSESVERGGIKGKQIAKAMVNAIQK